MRSHAKASSAGSSMGQASGLGRIVRGALAARAASSDADGSSAPSRGHLGGLILLFAALALLAFAPSAFASKGVVGFIGSSSEGSAAGQFSGPSGIAVNQAGNDGTGNSGAAAGDVYIVDRFNNRVQQFSASGTFKRAFGLNVGGAGVNVCTSSCGEGSSSSEAGAMSQPQGVAVDQANGLLYVTDRFNRRVDVFAANGAFQGAFGWGVLDGSAEFQFCTTTCHEPNFSGSSEGQGGKFGAEIGYPAVAPSGDVFVADKSNRRVDQFTPTINGSGEVTAVAFTRAWGWNVAASGDPGDTAANEFEVCTTACQAGEANAGIGGFGGEGPAALGIDSAGNSYVIDTSNKRVEKFGPGGSSPSVFAAAQLSGEPAPVDIAVDRTNNHVFAIKPCNSTTCPPGSLPPPFVTFERRVLEFDSSGALIDTHAAGAGIATANGLAESQSTGKLFLTTSGNGSGGGSFFGAFILDSPLIPPLATIDPGLGFAHTATTATFTGTVDPTGFGTSCHFEYSPDDANWVDVGGALGTGTLTAGSTTITDVSTAIGTFEGGQILESSDGGVNGENGITSVDPVQRTLTIPFAPKTSGPVTLTAHPRNVSACGGLDLNGGAQAVGQEATGLVGGQLYHVRLVAEKDFAAGSATSETTFTTDPGPPLISRAAVDWPQITTTSGTVETEINPQNQGTTYHVEYLTRAQFEEGGWAGASLAPTGSSAIGHGSQALLLFPKLTGLTPGTEYRARVSATNPSGTVFSPTLSFATYPEYGTLGSCPANEQFRSGPSAALPDCRAYEQASPVDKNGSDVIGAAEHIQASPSGDAISFMNQSNVPGADGAESFQDFIARRGVESWSTQGTLPSPSFGAVDSANAWTPDLSYSFSRAVLDNSNFDGKQDGAYLMRGSDRQVQIIAPYTNGASGYAFAGASSDDSKVFFEVNGAKIPVDSGPAPTATKNLYLYDRDTGQRTLVGVLPNSACASPPCVPAGGSFAGPWDWFRGSVDATHLGSGGANLGYFTQDEHAISSSGDNAFFTAGATGEIYMRKGLDSATPDTVQVSASQRTPVDPEGPKPKIFMRATPSGSVAFFTSCEKLTDDSTAVSTSEFRCDEQSQGADLYAYDTETGELRDLSVDANGDPEGAQVQGVIGASDNGEYVYFVANGVLASNEGPRGSHATLGDCRGEFSSGSFVNGEGSCNLYLWHDDGTPEGETTFVAPLDSEGESVGDIADWAALPGGVNAPTVPTAKVSADGRTIAFSSVNQLTDYDNEGIGEFYRYHVGEPGVLCMTCNPSGAPAQESTLFSLRSLITLPVAAVTTRNLSADGSRFFFDTPAKLVPADTNGDAGCPTFGSSSIPACLDAYEWEAAGTGSCHTSPGCLYLLSSGAGSRPSFFGDASADGRNAFIFTRDQLVPQDEDGLQDVYDASVGGGLASQHPVTPPSCEGEGCRGEASKPAPTSGAGTAVFDGPGNPSPVHRCAQGQLRRHGECVKRHRRRSKHHAKHSHHRAAAKSRGGAK